MKHLLNNMSEEEKNNIREQHAGGMKVMTENFNKLLKSKLGDAKPLVNEQMHMEDNFEDSENMEDDFEGVEEVSQMSFLLQNADKNTATNLLKKYMAKHSQTVNFVAVLRSEGVDLTDINFCECPNLLLVNLRETPNNFEETQGDCALKMSGQMWDFDLGDEKPMVNEQSLPQDYQEIANYLYNNMEGLSSSENAENIKTIILNKIKNKNDWEGVKKAFGVRDGENLEQWLSGEMRINLNDILKTINQNDSSFRKEDAMYNPGSKIRLITNRQFVIARAHQYSDIMGDKEELTLDIENATVIRRDKDGIVVKVPYVRYYNVGERKRGTQPPKEERLDNPCIKIPFKDVIEWKDDTLQIRWFSDFVSNHVVPCK